MSMGLAMKLGSSYLPNRIRHMEGDLLKLEDHFQKLKHETDVNNSKEHGNNS
jgi:hypothetical protein